MFVEFNILGYDGLEEVWQVDPDFWSYFEMLGELKDLGYSKVRILWYYDAMEDNELVLLKDDTGINRTEMIALINGNVHLYFMHPIYGEEQILSLENSVGPNGVEEDKLEDDTLDDLNNGVKGTFDDLGTFEDLNNLGDKFDEGGTTSVEDTTAVGQEDSFKNVNLDGTTEGIDQKDSCHNVKEEDGGSENDNDLNVNIEDSGEDIIGNGEEIVVDKEDGKGKGNGKGKIKGNGKGKGKDKGKGKSKGKGKGVIP
ncbi:hypothetical protein KIW84_061967 [Lathyrus oleraceus]|uniref:PB1-like domain-containing protein n=1 Tax=Pisum sativum TaxID=3888 RepID=A0A9D5A4X4_PEA|nr:hypothetical protein KIW84_061967 [Pisum sativum]